MVSHLDHDRNTEAVNPSAIPFHIIFLAKTMKYHPISCARALGRNPKAPVTPAFVERAENEPKKGAPPEGGAPRLQAD